jgi:hypothetical protein
MEPYHKIQTIFKRKQGNNSKELIINDWTLPEFEYLQYNKWECTEKIDGTNTRILMGEKLEFRGRTDRTNLPQPLVDRLTERFSWYNERSSSIYEVLGFDPDGGDHWCLYGEGYGPKIQNGGCYRADQDFILFDIKIGKYWLSRESVVDIANKLGLDVVPLVGQLTIKEAISMVQGGMKSQIADCEAEGLILKTPHGMIRSNGDRIITKIKCRDFK